MPLKKGFLARLKDKGWKEGPEGWLPPPPGVKPPPPQAQARKGGRKKSGMNSLEARYAEEVLERGVEDGVISSWSFESVRLRLSAKTFYTPDFMVLMADGVISFSEVKGFLREDAAVKFKWAREAYPFFEFRMMGRKSGEWREMLPESLGKKRPLTHGEAGG